MNTWVEIICAVALLYGAISGWRHGLIKELLSMCGFVVGLVLAWYFHDEVAGGGVLGFLCIAICAPIVLGWVASLLNVVLDHLLVLGSLNRLAGLLVGVAKWGLLIGCILLMLEKLGFNV